MSLQLIDNLDAIAAALERACRESVNETAEAIKDQAQKNAPEDTGALKAGIYVVTDKESGYAEAKTAVLAANPELTEEITTEFPLQDYSEPHTPQAIVDVIVDYAPHVEYGHVANY